ncbi:protein ZGRF1-like isoform X2 [Actinia tenebrosa]|uniref:5'-3' DNA helicase ZGRF1 n=1 Tax=Actinia tenebrosa TaxID=6105 RepID=A0A6P8I9F0_ACTTE|nr:protein ZGRF1-like isoform X2 [Actinia tenebrosa]
MSSKEFKVLYTHQKTKKQKTWQDGTLILYANTKKVVLYEDGTKALLDSHFVRSDQITIGDEIESERYLITIEEETNRAGADSNCQVSNHPCVVNSSHDNSFTKKNKEFCPPKFVIKEKKILNKADDEADERLNLCAKHFARSSKTKDEKMPSKNQFFTLYSKKNQDLVGKRKFDEKVTRRDDQNNVSTKRTPIINQSCYGKRDTSQILALFSANSVSRSEDKRDDILQVCPLSSSAEVNVSDDAKGFFQSSLVDLSHDDNKALTSITYNSAASPVRFHTLPVLSKPHSNPLVISENSYTDVTCDTGDDLFHVPDDDTKDHQIEPHSSNINNIGVHDITTRELAVGSRKEHQKQRQSSRHTGLAKNDRKNNSKSSCKENEHDLGFPTSKDCEDNVKPCREVIIPVTFENCHYYQQTLKAAVREHLNIMLFELAQNYHSALRKVDITQYNTVNQGFVSDERPSCPHGICCLRSVKKEGPNKGRLFYCCPGTNKSQCKFFKWVNEFKNSKQSNKPTLQTNKPSLCSADAVVEFFTSQGLTLHCQCRLIIKHKNTYAGKSGKQGGYRYSRKRLEKSDDNTDYKKSIYLELSNKRRPHVSYSKDDVWIVSKSLLFEKRSTFVAKSTYFGPFSSGELEISPIGGYSPSNWHSGDTVYALHGCNASNELLCIENIDAYVNNRCMPLLDSLLRRQSDVTSTRRPDSGSISFVPPTPSLQRLLNDIPTDVAVKVAKEIIDEYSLNTDQGLALINCANMFTDAPSNISLIQGVFGAGKSYLLAVTILYLVRLFTKITQNDGASNVSKPKILVSSTTNVAVDRILLVLLELGFEEFVRVGSIRKIAKQLLPYSMQGSGSQDQELKELQAMLKEDLQPSEKQDIRKSIEKQRRGENKKKLDGVQVVGVTCAACVFPCLERMKFSVVLLDECSQMTEPTALLPLARFGCQKLILVGDPKQLSPTIPGSTQGSHLENHAGLEQTLFDRLTKMGYRTTLLRTQYRCHPTISAVANRLFYEGHLVDGITPEDRTPLVSFSPTLCFYDVSRGQEKCGRDGSYYNEQEAEFVVFLVGCLLESGLEPEQLGVITLYKSQLVTISSHLAQSRLASHKQLKAVQISTVDAFQGGEKDVILLSCVRTDHVGFIDCGRRTNVALTRAKRHLLIIGNKRMLSSNELWRNVIEECRAQPDGVVLDEHFKSSWQKDDIDVPSQVTTDHQYPVNDMKDVPKFQHGNVLPPSPSIDNEIQDSCSQTSFDFLLESPSADDDVDVVLPKLSSTENSNDVNDKIPEQLSTGITNGMQSLSQDTSVPVSVDGSPQKGC